MNPRLHRIALDWKTYAALVAALGAGASAFTGIIKGAVDSASVLTSVAAEAPWLVAGLLFLLAVAFLVTTLSRRSILLEPSRFLLSTDNPDHLIGREEEIQQLVRQCRRHSMVFLVGDSGSGKSALVRAGLAEHLHALGANIRAGEELIPVVVDLSGAAWNNGLSLALARSLGRLPATSWQDLGGGIPPHVNDVFRWSRGRPAHAPHRLLIILDQFDDYLTENREHLYDNSTLRKPKEIEARNTDWKGLAEALRSGTVCILIVSRSEAAGNLAAFCFVEETAIAREQLTRLPRGLVAPLLDRLSAEVEGRAVISDPEFGWHQLRSRLLHDLETSGQGHILPIQLAVALNSLRLSQYLTPASYQRNGGLRGLERLHVKRHATKAAAACSLTQQSVIAALHEMVSSDALKTTPLSRSDFERLLTSETDPNQVLEQTVVQLEEDRIIRRIPNEQEGAETLLLYHDYLARGVREAYREANRWTEMLREGTQIHSEAIGWRQRWRGLLSPLEQVTLLWAWAFGKFRFGQHRIFLSKSIVRWMPIGLALALTAFGVQQLNIAREKQLAAVALGTIGHEEQMTRDEALEIRRLHSAGRRTATHALRLALTDSAIAARAVRRVDQLTWLAVGFDTDGDHSARLLEQVVLPALHAKEQEDAPFALAAGVAARLHLTPTTAEEIAGIVTARMLGSNDPETTVALASTLALLTNDVESPQLARGFKSVVQSIRGWKAYAWPTESLTVLANLAAGLDSAEALKLATEIMVGPVRDSGWAEVVQWLYVVRQLGKRLDARDRVQLLQMLAADFLARGQDPRRHGVAEALHSINRDVGSELGALAPTIQKLEVYLESHPAHSYHIARFLSLHRDRSQSLPLVHKLIARMVGAQDLDELAGLVATISGFEPLLKEADIVPVVEVLRNRAGRTTLDGSALFSLGGSFALLEGHLQSVDTIRIGTAALARMNLESDDFEFIQATSILARLARRLPKEYALDGANALLYRPPGTHPPLVQDLALLIDALPPKDASSLAATFLTQRLASADAASVAEEELLAMARIANHLQPQQVAEVSDAVIAAIMAEDADLAAISSVAAALTHGRPRDDTFIYAFQVLLSQVGHEWDEQRLARLVQALAALGPALPARVHLPPLYWSTVPLEQIYLDLLRSPYMDDPMRSILSKGVQPALQQANQEGGSFRQDLSALIKRVATADRQTRLDLEAQLPWM